MKTIGYMQSVFKFKNGTPRQAGICEHARGTLTIDKSIFNNPEHSLDGLQDFSHAWIIFVFHKNNNTYFKAKVRPPRLDGRRVGLFATRAPYRPNPIGLTLAKIEKISGANIHFSGIDLLDGTPVLDVKPYIPQYDCPFGVPQAELQSGGNHKEFHSYSADNHHFTNVQPSLNSDLNKHDTSLNQIPMQDFGTSRNSSDQTENSVSSPLTTTLSVTSTPLTTTSSLSTPLTTTPSLSSPLTTTLSVSSTPVIQYDIISPTIATPPPPSNNNTSPTTATPPPPPSNNNTSTIATPPPPPPPSNNNTSPTTATPPPSNNNTSPTTATPPPPPSNNNTSTIATPPPPPPPSNNNTSPTTATPPPYNNNTSPTTATPPPSNNNTSPTTATPPPPSNNNTSPTTATPPPPSNNNTSTIATPPPPSNNNTSPTTATPPPSNNNTSPTTATPPPSNNNTSPTTATPPPPSNNNTSTIATPPPPSNNNTSTTATPPPPPSNNNTPPTASTITSAEWVIKAPISKLNVLFTERSCHQLQQFSRYCQQQEFQLEYLKDPHEVCQAISSILSEDPRSVYRRNLCKDNLYYFSVDRVHVTCWFIHDSVEVLWIQPTAYSQHTK